jgi:hypothetical protein
LVNGSYKRFDTRFGIPHIIYTNRFIAARLVAEFSVFTASLQVRNGANNAQQGDIYRNNL